MMERDYSDPTNPYIYRPKPKARSDRHRPTQRKLKDHTTRQRIDDLLEMKRIEREHSL